MDHTPFTRLLLDSNFVSMTDILGKLVLRDCQVLRSDLVYGELARKKESSRMMQDFRRDTNSNRRGYALGRGKLPNPDWFDSDIFFRFSFQFLYIYQTYQCPLVSHMGVLGLTPFLQKTW